MATDFLVEAKNPEVLDKTLTQIGACLVQNSDLKTYMQREGYYVMRCLGNPGFIRFACENQGYCKIIKELKELS